jgi:predicted nucleic acid-binding protein
VRTAQCFLDTSILVRFLMGDGGPQAEQARSFFRAIAAGTLVAETSESALLELAHVLRSAYQLAKSEIADALDGLLQLDQLLMPRKFEFGKAIALWKEHGSLSLPDALHLTYAATSEHRTIASFDRAIGNRLAGVTRIEKLP